MKNFKLFLITLVAVASLSGCANKVPEQKQTPKEVNCKKFVSSEAVSECEKLVAEAAVDSLKEKEQLASNQKEEEHSVWFWVLIILL